MPSNSFLFVQVRKRAVDSPFALFSVISRGAEILFKLGYYWGSLSYDCLVGKGETMVAYRAQQLRNLLCDLGPSFIKAGQVLQICGHGVFFCLKGIIVGLIRSDLVIDLFAFSNIQVLANRPDIIRQDYMNELCILQDDVPAFPNKVCH
jgi:aarF domain-containing kinase